ncbi:hypothetical protein BSL78_07294 [Apostichopus japonicus]|uniref:Uncharacterized protein n=1 Tax=Stichopus japonicus TaxID=307972 RepID=A0A2G8L6C0_STIJA|nr:hypothetical protein BSL78_07294 [Apostichopus japonicus]
MAVVMNGDNKNDLFDIGLIRVLLAKGEDMWLIVEKNIRSPEVDRTEEQNKAGLQLLPLLLRENKEEFVSYTNTSNEFQKIAESVSTPTVITSELTCAIAAESQSGQGR